MNLQFSDMPESVAKFCDAIGDFGNVYHMYTVDMDGNITNEAFGKNVITDYGLLNRWKNHNEYYLKLYVGNSTDEPTLDGQSMINRVITVDATKVQESGWNPTNRNISKFPIKYIPATDNHGAIMTQRFQLAKFYYDYNITDVTEDIIITEIGLGDSDTTLYSHSLVYDADGNLSSIVKKPNERLYIQTYWQGAVPVAYIDDCYSRGQNVFIEPSVFSLGTYPDGYCSWYMARSTGNFSSQYATKNVRLARQEYAWDAYRDSLTNLIDHTVICNTKPYMDSLLLEHKFGYLSGVAFTTYNEAINADPSIEQFISHRGYWAIDYYYHGWNTESACNKPFILHEFLKLPDGETEELESEEVYTNSWSSYLLTNAFGRSNLENKATISDKEYFAYADGALPVIDFNISAMSRYNHKTKEWDIIETYYSDPDWNYDDSLMEFQGDLWTGEDYSIRCNPHWNTKKIVSFGITGSTVYATDTYWDTSSYQMIPNVKAVPDELSNKKYYLVKGTSYKRLAPSYFTNDTAPHKLLGYEPITIDMTGLIASKAGKYNSMPLSNMLSSDKNGWILLSKTLLYPDAEGGPKAYPIKYASDVTSDNELNRFCRHATDDMIIICDWSYNDSSSSRRYSYRYRIYDVRNPEVEPPYIDIDPPFTAKSSSSNHDNYQPIFSWADSGLLCGQQYGYNEACVIDVNNWETPVIRMIQNCRLAHIQNLTEYVVYQRSDITLVSRFEIMNPRTGEIVDTFDLPDYQTYTVNGICGWKTNVYIHVTYNGINDIVKYDMNTHALEFNNSSWNLMYTNSASNNYCHSEFSNEECYIITSSGNQSLSPNNWIEGASIFIDAKNPMNIEHLYNPQLPDANRLYFGLGKLKYVDNGNNLVYVAKHGHHYYDNQNIYDSALTVFDIGKRIDSGEPLTKIPFGHMPYTNGWEYGIYKDYIFAYDNGNTLTLYPIAWSLAHKVKGTTHTITSYNNPVKISGKRMHIKLTNDMEKLYNYDPSHNICP